MARLGGLGKGLGALIPAGEAGPTTPAATRRGSRSLPIDSIVAQPASAAGALRRGVAELSWRRRSARSACCSRSWCDRSSDGVRADRRRAAVACRSTGRPGDDPGGHPPDRRPRFGRAGAGREPAPPGSHPARRGGGVPTADRGLRVHPRAGGQSGRQEPLGGHQHAPADVAAAVDPAPAGRRTSVGRPCQGTARDARPRVPGAACTTSRAGGVVGAGRRGGGARPECRPVTSARCAR